MTHPSDIAGLSERLRDAAHDPTMGIAGYCLLVDEAAAALDSLTARVKELEAEVEKWHRVAMKAGVIVCENGGLIYGAIDRALRAEQQRDEAYERAAKVADGYCGVNFPPQYQHAEIIADAIRRLASGPDNGAKP